MKRVSYVFVLAVLVVASSPLSVRAAAGCSATITPATIAPTENGDFTLGVTSTGSDPIQWVEITVASGLEYAGNSINDWQTQDFASGVRVFGGWLSAGNSANFVISATAGLATGTTSWTVRASAALNGAAAATCSGTLNTTVTGSPPQQENNSVSNVAVSNITTSSARVTWDTEFSSTSVVYYGFTASYGSQTTDSAMTTSHAVNISGLQAGRTYHFQVASEDGQGTFAYSTDNTFTTAAAPATPPTTPPSTNGTTTTTTTTTTQAVTTIPRRTAATAARSQPPAIQVDTVLSGAYANPPVISGRAQDDNAVQAVFYSIDNGQNWLPVDVLTAAGTQNATFQFQPVTPEEKNYQVVVAAYDNEGQETRSAVQTLVIDRAPPQVGSGVMSIGPLPLAPGDDGVLKASVHIDQRMTLSTTGGATGVVIEATKDGSDKTVQRFTLTQSAESGLWSGALGFQREGTYTLVAKAVDGAGNNTSKKMNTIVVGKPGKVVDSDSEKPLSAQITVYYLSEETSKWELWEADSYSQANPVQTGSNGIYGLYLPVGTYYMNVSAEGHRPMTSKSFTLKEPTIIADTITLSKGRQLSLGLLRLTLPHIVFRPTDVQITERTKTADLSMKNLPIFAITPTDGKTRSTVDLYGKPTIIAFASTWAPMARDQLAVLNTLPHDDTNIIVVMMGENAAKVQTFAANAGYTFPIVVDQAGTFADQFGVTLVPTMFIADRSGKVQAITRTPLSSKEIQHYVSQQ